MGKLLAPALALLALTAVEGGTACHLLHQNGRLAEHPQHAAMVDASATTLNRTQPGASESAGETGIRQPEPRGSGGDGTPDSRDPAPEPSQAFLVPEPQAPTADASGDAPPTDYSAPMPSGGFGCYAPFVEEIDRGISAGRTMIQQGQQEIRQSPLPPGFVKEMQSLSPIYGLGRGTSPLLPRIQELAAQPVDLSRVPESEEELQTQLERIAARYHLALMNGDQDGYNQWVGVYMRLYQAYQDAQMRSARVPNEQYEAMARQYHQ